MKKKTRSSTVYFASELFTLKHLIGNAYLAEAIYEKSQGRYLCELPQDFEPRGTTARAVRDQDIKALMACDLALFNFDGTELDSGTVVEFMFAKFADIPCVILRSDLRKAGDGNDPVLKGKGGVVYRVIFDIEFANAEGFGQTICFD